MREELYIPVFWLGRQFVPKEGKVQGDGGIPVDQRP